MLRQYNLDDERFAEIAERARLKAPEYFPGWNDINTHDPGVTLLELFAWLTEQQRFHLDQSEDASAFFPLLGVTPRHGVAARADIIIAGGFLPRVIPARTPVYADNVRFETIEDICYEGAELSVQVIQRESTRMPFVLGYARGVQYTRFTVEVGGQIILRDGFSLSVGGKAWDMMENFNTSRPYDKHYTLNGETGEIAFGDGIRGEIPRGEVTVTAMELTRGEGGNIAPMRLTQLEDLPVWQPNAAKGGASKESVKQVMARAMQSDGMAVTSHDIEELVLQTPGISVERVRAYESGAEVVAGEARVINIVVLLSEGRLTEELKRRIHGQLEPYRLVCRDFRIAAPQEVRVGLTMELKAGPHGADFRVELEDSLIRFFYEYYGGFGAVIRPGRMRAYAASFPEVLEVSHCAFRLYGGARLDAQGIISLPQNALAKLGDVFLRITDSASLYEGND